jgi:glycerophosphoryl diester phosphodiesterase
VISHDAKVGRDKIERATAKEVSQLPRLRDVLQRYRDSFLDIELKVKGLERTIVDLFLRLKPRKGCVVSSFLPGALKSLHAEDATVPLGLICETKTQLRLWNELPIHYVIPHYELVDAELIRKVKGAGKKVMVWTVNDAIAMRQFAEWGVDGIISDDTKLLVQTLAAGRGDAERDE